MAWYDGLTQIEMDAMGGGDGAALGIAEEALGLAEKTEKKVPDYLYNLNGLKKFFASLFPKVVYWGDSITAGAGADLWHSNWVYQFSDTIQLTKGSMYGRGYVAVNDAGTPAGWTLETKGINQFRAFSTATALTISAHPLTDRTIQVLYSKETDGGDFDVTIDGAVIATASCTGATSYGNKLVVTVPKTKSIVVTPKGKTYIEGFNHYGYDNKPDGILVHKVGHGGFSAGQFSDAEIKASISTFTPDLTCIGHIVNDVGTQNLALYRSKIEVAINTGKLTGDVLLYIPCRGKLEVEGPPRQYPFDDYKEVLYELALKYDCALLDFDKYLGGYTNAKNKELLFDDVHPNQKGHDLMARAAIFALVPSSVPSQYKISHGGNVGGYYDLLLQLPKVLGRLRVTDDILFDGIIKGYTDAVAGETYLRVNKMKIVNDGSADLLALEGYGATGSIVTMKDKTQPNILQIRNANNLSTILSGRTLEIDTTDANKFGNFVKIKNFLVAESGIQIGAPVAASVLNNSFFVEAGVLKFKDGTGVIKTVTLA